MYVPGFTASFFSVSRLTSSTQILMDYNCTTTSSSSGEVIMAALHGFSSESFSDLTHSLYSDLRLHRRRLAFLLFSPLHFSATLSYLRSLSLSQKTLLLARLLLSSLQLLFPSLSGPSNRLRLRDLDAALLLMAMCDSYDPAAATACDAERGRSTDWRSAVAEGVLRSALSPSGLGGGAWPAVSRYVDAGVKSRRLMEVLSEAAGGEKAGGDAAASVAAVVALPSVECGGGRCECVICKEEMEKGRDVCELPCRHRFHWGCALGWLRKRNTCPCCRHELPTEDVVCEMGRMWKAVATMAKSNR